MRKKIRKTILKFNFIKYHVQCVSGQAADHYFKCLLTIWQIEFYYMTAMQYSFTDLSWQARPLRILSGKQNTKEKKEEKKGQKIWMHLIYCKSSLIVYPNSLSPQNLTHLDKVLPKKQCDTTHVILSAETTKLF